MVLYFVAAAGFLVLSWLAYKQPVWALYCILALMPAYLLRLNIFALPTSVLELLILGGALGTFMHNLKKENWQKSKLRLLQLFKTEKYWLIILGIILISSVVAIFIAPEKIKALGLARAYIWEPIWLFLLFTIYWQKENIEKAIFFLIPSALLINLLNFYQIIRGEGLIEFDGFSENMRVTGPYDYPNAVGLFLAPITIFLAYFIFKYFKEKKNLRLSGIFILISANLLSIYWAQSEAALLAILLTGFLVALNFKYLRSLAIIAAIGVLALAYQFNYLDKIWEKLTLQDFSGEIRQHIYMETSEMLQDNFLLGAGLASYQSKMENYHLNVLIMRDKDRVFEQPVEIYLYPHNIILNFWSEFGFLAMLSFLFIIIYYIIKNYILFWKKKNLLALFSSATLLVILLHGLFDVPYFKNDLAIMFWFVMAAAVIVEVELKKEDNGRN